MWLRAAGWILKIEVCLIYAIKFWDLEPPILVWRRKWQPTPVFLLGESHGRRSLLGYSPWVAKESDMTERLHFHFHYSGPWGFPGGSVVKNPLANAGDMGSTPGSWRSWEGNHSSILAWKIPWTEKPFRLQSMGSWRAGLDWAHTHILVRTSMTTGLQRGGLGFASGTLSPFIYDVCIS